MNCRVCSYARIMVLRPLRRQRVLPRGRARRREPRRLAFRRRGSMAMMSVPSIRRLPVWSRTSGRGRAPSFFMPIRTGGRDIPLLIRRRGARARRSRRERRVARSQSSRRSLVSKALPAVSWTVSRRMRVRKWKGPGRLPMRRRFRPVPSRTRMSRMLVQSSRGGGEMAKVTLNEAGRLAVLQEMRADPTIWVLGEDVASGGLWGQYRDFIDEFGPQRIVSTPISESTIMGAGLGAALVGTRPIIEMRIFDFVMCAMDELVNQ